MNWMIPLLFLVLSGCLSAKELALRDYAECQGLAQQYRLEDVDGFMARCLAVTGGGSVAYMPVMGYNPGIGIGPYGPMGPTWQEFNSVFQQPLQPYQIIPPPQPVQRR